MYFVNSEWTTEYFINTLREKVRQDFQINYNAINNKERQNYLSRSNNLSGFL